MYYVRRLVKFKFKYSSSLRLPVGCRRCVCLAAYLRWKCDV